MGLLQQLNAEVEYLVKTSELLVLKGIPTKEKNDRVGELLVVHQRVRDKIREYETVLSMTLKFHQLYQEVMARSSIGHAFLLASAA